MSEMISIEHRRVGPIEVAEEAVLYFEEIPGFPGAKRFIVMDHEKDSPFCWLVSLDDADLAFVIGNPWNFFPDYDPAIPDAEFERLQLEKSEDVEVVALVSVEGERIWFNLAAPILINQATRKATQVISESNCYAMRVELPKPQDVAKAAEAQPVRDVVQGTDE